MNLETISIDELATVAQTQGTKGKAFRILFDRVKGPMATVVNGILHDAAATEEIILDTFVTVGDNFDKYTGSGFKSWSYRIATNAAINIYRRNKKSPDTIQTDLSELEIADRGNDSPDSFLKRDDVNRAFADIPDAYGDATRLYLVHGMPYVKIAKTLELNIGTVKSQIFRGREFLKERLAKYAA